MSWYFFSCTGKTKWNLRNADDREKVLAEEKPEFTTILDVNDPLSGTDIPEGLAYRGPLYFDWDGDDSIDALLDDVRGFIAFLGRIGFDPNEASWWLSGKRGVHCTIPAECFMDDKPRTTGVANLPLVYRQMAFGMVTEYLDLRVYTARKGRMWRTHLNPRVGAGKDGEFDTWKVSVSPARLKTMNSEEYWEWCSEPRPVIVASPPTPNMQLRTDFVACFQSVTGRLKEKVKNPNVLKDWKTLPPTIEAAFNGEGVLSHRDLNDIKLQFATAAVAIGIDDVEVYLKKVSGFIESRIGLAGATHRTREAITRELRTGFEYVLGNYSYSYSAPGFASILDSSVSGNLDLRGVDVDAPDAEKQGQLAEELASGLVASDYAVLKLVKDGVQPVSDYSWKESSLQVVMRNEEEISEYSVIPIVKGREMSRVSIPISTLSTAAKLQMHIARYGGTITLSSPKDIAAFKKALLNFVGDEVDAPQVQIISTEGLHVVPTSDPEDQKFNNVNMYWIEQNKVIASPRNVAKMEDGSEITDFTYVEHHNPEGRLGVDLSEAPTIATTPIDMGLTLEKLLQVNGNDYTLAILLGWFTGCLIKQPLWSLGRIRTFPLLQIVGQAGSGKTTIANLMLKMFTYRKPYTLKMAGDSLTVYALEQLITGSTTVPIVMDEFKRQNLKAEYASKVTGILQNVYTIGLKSQRGGGDSAAGTSYQSLTGAAMTAPMAFMSETIESAQSSIMERSVIATFTKTSIMGRRDEVMYLNRNSRNMAIIGWSLVNHLMEIPFEQVVELHEKNEKEVTELLYEGGNDRILDNAVMVTTGFDFFVNMCRKHFGDRFDQRFEALRGQLLRASNWTSKVTTEVSAMLQMLSTASHLPETSRVRTLKGFHFRYQAGESAEGRVEFLHISSERCFMLYRELMNQSKLQPAFNSPHDLWHALSNSIAAVDSIEDTILGPRTVVFDPNILRDEGVSPFN